MHTHLQKLDDSKKSAIYSFFNQFSFLVCFCGINRTLLAPPGGQQTPINFVKISHKRGGLPEIHLITEY